ncbi:MULTISPECIES: ABC transporter ATP-binding protein [unclassified Frankia]|uniref:ABC transporter ATP-binding protein n=1 Tax=unclassified Frankia TaxID=2632575 RepID=UPI001EF45A16|nr:MULTISPECIES: ATP-binding cassette domain-containing protein [unclassified Frankia]
MTGDPVRLSVSGLCVSYGKVEIVHDVSFTLSAGKVTGLIGPNGAGKTTLIDAVTGFTPASAGQIVLDGTVLNSMPPHERFRHGLTRTFQSLELFEDLSVAENLAVAGPEPAVALGLGMLADQLPATLSHDERLAVGLGRALAAGGQVLLVDEPAAGLDSAARATLTTRLRRLAERGYAILLVDHDIKLVFEACDDVVVLGAGRVVAYGPPATVRDRPEVREVYLGGSPATAVRVPTQPSKHKVLALEGVTSGYDRLPVMHEVTLDVHAGEIVALLGPNGAGKTTLIRSVSGQLTPFDGRVSVLGHPARRPNPAGLARRGLAVAPQGGTPLRGLTVRQILRLAVGRRPGDQIERTLASFPALRPLLDRTGGELSGGERQQVALASAVARQPKLLIVDEFSSGLAPDLASSLLAVLRRLADERGTGILLIEQHVSLALAAADRAYILDRGRIVFTGTAAALAADPGLINASYFGIGSASD